MTNTTRLIATPDEAEAFIAAHPDVDAIDIIWTNFTGVPRGKRLRPHEATAVYRDGRFLPGSASVVDITGRDCEETGLVWDDGDADRRLLPIPGTMRLAPWASGAAQFLTSFYELDGTPHALDPRHILARCVERLGSIGLVPDVAVELEFYLVDAKRPDGARPRPARGPSTGEEPTDIQVYGLHEMEEFRPFFDEVYACGDAMGLPLEAAISEYAPGQFEMTLAHKADALAACDDAILYKRMLKAVALKHGFEATFMAKPFADSAGNGMHLHASLLDATGKNAFASEDAEGTPLLREAIAGMQATMADAFLLFAPNANSYRRFKANSYAPVAPTWGVNNRTVSFRVTAGAPASRHVEHRIAGADANPYLALAAVLSGMHHGITHHLDPGPAVVGNGYEAASDAPPMPTNWFAATDRFSGSAWARDYFGSTFVDMYSTVKRTEQDRYFGAVPDLDYTWYLRNA